MLAVRVDMVELPSADGSRWVERDLHLLYRQEAAPS
jgi:hypothetical protein